MKSYASIGEESRESKAQNGKRLKKDFAKQTERFILFGSCCDRKGCRRGWRRKGGLHSSMLLEQELEKSCSISMRTEEMERQEGFWAGKLLLVSSSSFSKACGIFFRRQSKSGTRLRHSGKNSGTIGFGLGCRDKGTSMCYLLTSLLNLSVSVLFVLWCVMSFVLMTSID